MDGDEQTSPDEDYAPEREEARRIPIDAYAWVIFFLLLAIVACLVLLSYAVITLRTSTDTLHGARTPRAAVALIEIKPRAHPGNGILEARDARD